LPRFPEGEFHRLNVPLFHHIMRTRLPQSSFNEGADGHLPSIGSILGR
jgi:hypothetical protein